MTKWILAGIVVSSAVWAAEGRCDRPFETEFQHDQELRIQARSGDIDVVGTDSGKIRVTCETPKSPSRAADIEVEWKPGKVSELRVNGGPMSDVRIRIEVPRRTHLWIRSPAGDLTVARITGNKDIEIHAGDLKIDVGNPEDYKSAEGSVRAGDIQARAFGVSKGGLFRSFKKDGPGQYRLHAHVGAGDLVLR